MQDRTELAGVQKYPLPRRGLMMTGLISGFTLATQRVEAQAIHTDTTGLDAGETRIPLPDGTLPAYYARPVHGDRFPVVLVFEEIFGVHEYIKDVCRRLAKLGCLAVATEYYARLGDLATMTDVRQIFRDVIAREPDAQFMQDADATVRWAGTHGGDPARLGVTGFCRGGRQTWLYAAHNPHLRAAVAWYGPIAGATSPIQPHTVLDIAGQIRCPLLGLYGGQDQSIAISDVHAAEAKAKAAGRTVEIIIYPDAPHGFHADYRPSYRPADATDGWKHAVAWFRHYGVLPAAG